MAARVLPRSLGLLKLALNGSLYGQTAVGKFCTASGLKTQVALVTGSTSGIGQGVAESLASRGCNVILNGFGDPNAIKTIQNDIESKYNVEADFVDGDLSKQEEIQKLCQQIDELYPKGIDILVNNAGLQHVSPVEEFPVERWDLLIAVMLSAPFHLTRHFLPKMKTKGWGRIVNLASIHGIVASPNKAAYVSAKHGVLGLTKVVALEAATSGVTCNALCPGFVETEIFKKQIEARAQQEGCSYNEAKRLILQLVHPTMEPVGVDQVSEYVAFICSRAADQMTGSIMTMDGGWTAR
ncbi:hypothetical protein ScPMuIL_007103 [Solemya velum]